MVAGLLRTELSGEPLGAEERRQTPNDGPFALGILISSHLGIGRREDRMCLELGVASRLAGQGSVKCLDSLVVAVEEIIRHADAHGCLSVGAVEAERSF